MAHPKVSKRRAKAIASSIFFIFLAVISFTGAWWPGIMIAIGIPLAIKQFLLGRLYDAILSLIVFGGVFFVSGFEVSWEVLLPIVFIVSSIYILFREFFDPDLTTEAEEEESLSHEITEDQED